MTRRSIACSALCLSLLSTLLVSCKSNDTSKPMVDTANAVASFVADAARGKSVTVVGPPNSMYAAGGASALVDGKMGSEDHMDLEWLGWWYEDKPFCATIDLGRRTSIRELRVHTLTSSEAWIFYPRKVHFEVSDDGENFAAVASVNPSESDLLNEEPDTTYLTASGLTAAGRYVRVRAERYGELPDWHMGHGGADGYEGQAWLFVDEILVNPR